jgi:hypothetical protein
MTADKYQQGGNWCIRGADGRHWNLNTPQAADYVLDLQRRVAELQAELELERRGGGRRGRKPGPSENK